MPTFAQILDTILRAQKAHKHSSLVALARRAQLSPSYLSNLRQSRKAPRQPSHKALTGLVQALREVQVLEYDLRRLVEAAGYHWTTFERALSPTEQEDTFPLLETLRQGFEIRGIVRNHLAPGTPEEHEPPTQGRLELSQGDQRILLQQATELLLKAARRARPQEKQRIVVSWFAALSRQEPALRDAQEQFVDALRALLGANSPWEVWHFWKGEVERAFTPMGDVLAQVLGTSNYALYEVPHSAHLPEVLIIERQSALVALPDLAGQYSMFALTAGPAGTEQAYLAALLAYLETLVGPEGSRHPVLQTYISEAYALLDLAQLAWAEERDPREDRLLVTSAFSAVFRPAAALREWLRVEQQAEEHITRYMQLHERRVAAFTTRLASGQERSIHAKEALKKRFQHLAQLLAAGGKDDPAHGAEVRVRQGELQQVLACLAPGSDIPSSRFHLGLVDSLGPSPQQPPPFFELVGNMAFFQSPEDPDDPWGKQPSAMAWTDHPGILFQLRHEFDAWWQEIPSDWRTDTREGKEQVIQWIVTESLQALLQEKVPPGAFWAFAGKMMPVAIDQPAENFYHELIAHEQDASRILIINAEFPVATMPLTVGPWDGKNLRRTRQRLLSSILGEGKHFEVIVSEVGINRYRKENKYGKEEHAFTPEETQKHIANIAELRNDPTKHIHIDVVPAMDFLVNFEVLNNEVVFIETSEPRSKPGGMVLHNKELAQAITHYAEKLERYDVSEWLAGKPERHGVVG